MGLEILDGGFGELGIHEYYGFFKVSSDPQAFEILSGFIGIKLEMPEGKTLR
jgi:hypothetical protein